MYYPLLSKIVVTFPTPVFLRNSKRGANLIPWTSPIYSIDTHLLEELLSRGQSAMISTCPVEFQNNKPLDFVTGFKLIV